MNEHVSTAPAASSPSNAADSISRRAYEIWQQVGCPEGQDLCHWLQAEDEVSGRSEFSFAVSADCAAGMKRSSTKAEPQAGDTAARAGKRSSKTPVAFELSASTPGAKLDFAGRRRV